MDRHTRRSAALAVAWLGCTPIAPPTRRLGEPALERIADASSPHPATVLLLDASPLEEPDADAVVDWTPSPVGVPREPPGMPPPDAFDRLQPTLPIESEKDAAQRRVRGSPADVHTLEGAAHGYSVCRHCPNYYWYDVVAVSGTGRKPIPQLGRASPDFGKRPSEDIEKEFWTFAMAVRRAAAVSSIHDYAPSPPCFGRDEDAVILYLHDWRQVDQAIHNVGSWLAARDWYGDVILCPQPIPGPTYPK